jgi:transposase-like protein
MATRTTDNLSALAKHYSDEDAAREFLEKLRWPNGAACPHCGGAEPYRLTPKVDSKKPGRKGLWKCKACRKQFTVTVKTVMEDSRIPISKWLLALHLLASSKKGMSAHQLHRMLSISYKAAWFMAHRLRYAMASGPLGGLLEGVIEADETYIGGKRRQGRYPYQPKHSGMNKAKDSNKAPVVALVQRGGGVRAFPMPRVTGENMKAVLKQHVSKNAVLMTDESSIYNVAQTREHHAIKHKAGIYAEGTIHTNTVEGFFALLKRGIMGSFHHVSKGHLFRYCDEFAFRYNTRMALGYTDGERAALIVTGAEGKRLTYKQPTDSRAV